MLRMVRRCIVALFFLGVLLLLGCSFGDDVATRFEIEVEMTQGYDDSDPFIDERLFYVSDSADSLELDVSFQMEGEGGLLEIADNETKEVFWSDDWNGDIDSTEFTISLDSLAREREYVIRFTGTKLMYAKLVITSDNSLIKERERPAKKDK